MLSCEVVVYDLIDMIYKLEAEISKITIEVKSITDAKWNKYLLSYHFVRYLMTRIILNSSLEKLIWDQLQGSRRSCDLVEST